MGGGGREVARRRRRAAGVAEGERRRGREREREAKSTETSLLWSFQQKLAVANNARHGIHRAGGGRGGSVYISGVFLKHNWPSPSLTLSASRDAGKMHRDVVFWPSDARWRAATTATRTHLIQRRFKDAHNHPFSDLSFFFFFLSTSETGTVHPRNP